MNKLDKYRLRTDFEEDASYNTWMKLFLPVYSKIPVFSENFDFNNICQRSSGKINRLAVPAKEQSALLSKYRDKLNKSIPEEQLKELECAFWLSGDTDFNISGVNCHRLDNYSLMPITGALNNEKGKTGSINDNWALYIFKLPELIKEDVNAYNGRYKDSLISYRKDIVKSARQAYYSLFDNDIYKYCYNVYFYGVNDSDGDLFERAKNIIDCVIANQGVLMQIEGRSLEDVFWECRRCILKNKYDIEI